MESSQVRRAVEAARLTACELGLQVNDAVVIYNSDRIAVRLIPCDVPARIAPQAWEDGLQFEAAVARSLAESDSPAVRQRFAGHGPSRAGRCGARGFAGRPRAAARNCRAGGGTVAPSMTSHPAQQNKRTMLKLPLMVQEHGQRSDTLGERQRTENQRDTMIL